MRIISLHQPHAAFVQYGLKPFETRGWSTNHRGCLLIHAAKRPMTTSDWQLAALHMSRCFGDTWWQTHRLFYGAVVAAVDLDYCVPVEYLTCLDRSLSNGLGNFSEGRFAWHFCRVRSFVIPIHTKGHQRFWNIEINLSGHEMTEMEWRKST